MTAPDTISELLRQAEAKGNADLARHLRAWLYDVITGAAPRPSDRRREESAR